MGEAKRKAIAATQAAQTVTVPRRPISDCPPQRQQAVFMYNSAVEAMQKNKDEASKHYSMMAGSVFTDPSFAEGWFGIGSANSDMKLLPAAIACFHRYLEFPDGELPGDARDDMRVRAMVEIGHKLYHMGRYAESRHYTEAALRMAPNNAFGWCNLSLLESHAGNHATAIEYAEKSYRLDATPLMEMGLAFAHLFAGNFAEGLKHFESRFPCKLKHFLDWPMPEWEGQNLAGKTLYISADQGMGDTLSFARFIPLVAPKAAKVILAIQSELVRLFSAMLCGYQNIEIRAIPEALPYADYWTTPMSLPVPLGLTTEQIIAQPHLDCPAFTLPNAQGWKVPNRKLHVGICWAGSPQNDQEPWRAMQPEHFLELSCVPGLQMYSFQVGERAQDLHQSGGAVIIRDLSPYIRDVCDTVAIMREMDLIVCVETSLGHIAGLMGKPAIICYSKHGRDWRIRDDGTSIWYPQQRTVRQETSKQWQPVMDTIAEMLKEMIDERS